MKSKNSEKIIVLSSFILVVLGLFVCLIPLQQIYVQVSATATPTNSNANPPLPVLLIHGYLSDASVWKKWEDLLKKDNISVFQLTFKQSDDKCGSAAEHAKELSNQIASVKDQTGQLKVNIVVIAKVV